MSHLDCYGGERGHIDRATLTALIKTYDVRSMLDVGCGPGSMVSAALDLGLDAYGIDGHAAFAQDGPPRIVFHDLEASAWDVGPVDLIWCHEVAEHLAPHTLGFLLQTFRAGRFLMLSAATPGIGGIHHVNEQPASYWMRLLETNGWSLDPAMTGHVREIGESWFIRHHGQVFVRSVHP